MNSILKDTPIDINLSKIKDVKRLFFSHYSVFRESKLGVYGLKSQKVGHYTLLKELEYHLSVPKEVFSYPDIYARYRQEINDVENKREIVAKSPLEESTYLFLTEILLLELVLEKKRRCQPYKSVLKRFMLMTKNRFVVKDSEQDGETHGTKTRSSLTETASNAIEWTREGREPISYEINELLAEINPLLVEIPKDYDVKRLVFALKRILSTLKFFGIKQSDFAIRFKKLGTYKKKAMYIKSSNTIVLDARHVHLFQHELGHYLYESGIDFIFNNNKYTKKVMESTVEYLKTVNPNIEEELFHNIRKIEGYKVDSEIFAHWFENIAINIKEY